VPKASKLNFQTMWQSVREAILSRAMTKLKTCILSADKIKPQRKKTVKFGLYSLSGSDIQKGQLRAHTMQTKSNDTNVHAVHNTAKFNFSSVSVSVAFTQGSLTQAKNKSLIFTHVHSRLCVSDINKSQHSRNKTLNNTSAHTGRQDLMTDMQPPCTKQESFTNTVCLWHSYMQTFSRQTLSLSVT